MNGQSAMTAYSSVSSSASPLTILQSSTATNNGVVVGTLAADNDFGANNLPTNDTDVKQLVSATEQQLAELSLNEDVGQIW